MYALANDYTLRAWDLTFAQLIWEFVVPSRVKHSFSPHPPGVAGSGDELFGIGVRPNERNLAEIDIGLWEAQTGLPRGTVKSALKYQHNGFAVGPPGSWLVTLDTVQNALLGFDLRTGWSGTLGRFERSRPYRGAVSSDGRFVAVGSLAGEVTVWATDRPTVTGELAPADLDRLWSQLGSAEPQQASAAVAGLVARPGQAVPLLKERWARTPGPDRGAIRAAIETIDADDPRVRRRAAGHLLSMGGGIRPALRAAFQDPKATAERRGFLAEVNRGLGRERWAEADLRRLRAVEVLATINTPGARAVLAEIGRAEATDPAVWYARAVVSGGKGR